MRNLCLIPSCSLFCLQSNIVVTGVPTKNYKLPSEWIQPNTTVVNVASFKNVAEDEILQIEGVQYVSMVGKVTGEEMMDFLNVSTSCVIKYFRFLFNNLFNETNNLHSIYYV